MAIRLVLVTFTALELVMICLTASHVPCCGRSVWSEVEVTMSGMIEVRLGRIGSPDVLEALAIPLV